MIYELLETAIEQQNSFMTRDMVMLQIEFFYTAGRITEEERNRLLEKLNPVVEEEIKNIIEG
ncbi:hypothetical protein FYJ27_08670 [Anaerosalibacter bizertensis]|uniref:Uncharacterized protein n=1 Tax=Anaerosalibacter bizertensis TaxID=932217 RepID=A0A844FIK7_9FIRM|nr:hypothetical protein [Anaerosalibacter bizertensis]MSS43800.1 hypothetical protein [Anaerosalibacter bizertensis]